MELTDLGQLDDRRPIVPGDVLRVRMLQEHGGPLKVKVAENGIVVLPHMGPINAQGLTCRQLAWLAKKEMERLYYAETLVMIALAPYPAGMIIP